MLYLNTNIAIFIQFSICICYPVKYKCIENVTKLSTGLSKYFIFMIKDGTRDNKITSIYLIKF